MNAVFCGLLATCIATSKSVVGFSASRTATRNGGGHHLSCLPSSSCLYATANRRDAILQTAASAAIYFVPGAAVANNNEEDLTSQLYNADGSLKDANTVTEAKSRPVVFQLQSDEDVIVDGKADPSSAAAAGTAATIRYALPAKWANKNNNSQYNYQDIAAGRDTCRRISVYRIPVVVASNNNKNELLSQAAQRGVTTTLDTQRTIGLAGNTADLISGRRSDKNSQYYEFDMARAPSTCNANDAENLGLGFCPYEDIFLLSATVVDDKLYVFCIEADKDQWKFANAELRRIRSSFRVEV